MDQDENYGILVCEWCEEELIATGNSIKFIKFDHTTKMYHKRCYKDVKKVIESSKEATAFDIS